MFYKRITFENCLNYVQNFHHMHFMLFSTSEGHIGVTIKQLCMVSRIWRQPIMSDYITNLQFIFLKEKKERKT